MQDSSHNRPSIDKMDVKLPASLNYYNESNFAIKLKVRVFYYLCLAAIFGVFLLIISSIYGQINSVFNRINYPVLLVMVLVLLIFISCLWMLIKGWYNSATHIFMVSANICVWFVMFIFASDVIAQIDTIVFVLAIINIFPLFINQFKSAVFIYVAVNIIILVVFILIFKDQYRFTDTILVDYIVDNTIAILFSGIAAYLIISINNKTIDKIEFDYNKRIETEAALQSSEFKYRNLFENAQIGIYQTTPEGKILQANPELIKMLGYNSFEDIITCDLNNIEKFVDTNRQFFIEQIEKQGFVKDLEIQWKKKNGEIIDVRENSRAVRDKNGKTIHYEGFVTDITDQKRATKALKQSEDRIRTIMESLNEVIIVADNNHVVQYVNKRFTEILGYTPNEIIGKVGYKILHDPDDYKTIERANKERINSTMSHYEIPFITKDGRKLDFLVNGSPLIDDKGNTIASIGAMIDITDRKKAEKALKESQKLFQTLAEAAPVGIFRTDAKGRTTYVNPRWSEITGFSMDNATDMGWLNAVHPDDRKVLVDQWNSKLSNAEKSFAEYRFLRPDGSIIWVLGNAVPEFENEVLKGYIGTITNITELKQIQEKLVESEKKFRDMTELLPIAIWESDLNGLCTYTNKIGLEIHKYTAEDLLNGVNVFNLIIPEDRKRAVYAIKNRLAGQKPNGEEYTGLKKDGSTFPVRIYTSIIYEGNKPIGYRGATIDISEAKVAEKELKESEERYRAIIEAFPDIIMISDLKGNIIFGNSALEKITGITDTDYPNPNRIAHIHPDDIQMVKDMISELMRSDKLQTPIIENRFIDNWGNLHWFSGIMSKVTINDQLCLQTITRDITEKKNIEQELENYRKHLELLVQERTDELAAANEELTSTNEELLNQREELEVVLLDLQLTQKQLVEEKRMVDSLMENIPDAIYFKDLESKFIKVSKSMEYKDETKESLIGKTDFDLFTFEHAQPAFDTEQNIIKTGNSVIDLVEKETWKDGRITYASTTKMPLRDAYGKIIGTFGISRDITRMVHLEQEIKKQNEELIDKRKELEKALATLKEAQNKLVYSEKMASLGLLAAGVAHEINNPLNFIKGGIVGIENFINDNYKQDIDELAPLIEGINIGVERAAAIVASLNHYNRRDELPFVKCDIHSVINNCLVMLQNQTKNRIEIEKRFTKENYNLLCNEGKIHQALLNILANAVQAIQDKGKIVITTAVKQNKLQIQIKDSGCGISKDIMPKILDPFFTTKDPGKGTGLGLSITYNILQEHNGTIDFSSQTNNGTTVKIILPLNKEKYER